MANNKKPEPSPEVTKFQIRAGQKRVIRLFLVMGILISALMFFIINDCYQKGDYATAKTYFISWFGTFFMGTYIAVLLNKRIKNLLASKGSLPRDGNEYITALRKGGLKFHWHILLVCSSVVIIILVFNELFM